MRCGYLIVSRRGYECVLNLNSEYNVHHFQLLGHISKVEHVSESYFNGTDPVWSGQ